MSGDVESMMGWGENGIGLAGRSGDGDIFYPSAGL